MIVVLLILLFVASCAGLWFAWPTLQDDRERFRRLRQIDRIREQAFIEMDFAAEQARRNRLNQSQRRLDRFANEHEL